MRAPAFLAVLAVYSRAVGAVPATALQARDAAPDTAAAPTPPPALDRRESPTDRWRAADPWVVVDDEGQPSKTVTPSLTTIDGTPSAVADAAPHDLTASVYTWTTWGQITTSTGEPPNPTATNAKTGEGSFSRCFNKDGPNAPFCRPAANSTLLTGSTYYITWDPDYYNRTSDKLAGNSTYEVAVRLEYLNTTSKEMVLLDTFERVPAAWGFRAWKVDRSFLKGNRLNNVTISLHASVKGSYEVTNKTLALPVAITDPDLDHTTPSPVPKGDTLVIALPVVFGTIALLVVGLCVWNRKTRRIDLGDIMSRARRRRHHGYDGRSRRRDLFRSGGAGGAAAKDNGIQLDATPVSPPLPGGHGYYSDELPSATRPRRDSDGLGSLAGSPVDPSFERQGTTGAGRNAFRDEVARQERQKRGDDTL
ncbi:hypothetical protein JDV02_009399 [Purpureocillium takamizusanense]|uniref:Uncharacterized protein n=1 Tax=Purpureocillium takamizusanense TaxID=2060973 RepID=A0A9Q8QLY9_9HYPO|nr:uncharacterized protein JDV02_009399 [Purpureocillium takamizusanense]UNI23589.1 hypothetical protein JDV02_009399 [Purpureocillium takamizusanense]